MRPIEAMATTADIDVTRGDDAGARPAPRDVCRVEIWAALVPAGDTPPRGTELLDQDDRQWCARLHRPAARRQFETAHVLLRLALADAVKGRILPREWRFERDTHGKPALAPEFPQLHFNLSHERQIAAVAVCATNPVGIDVVRLAASPRKPPLWSAVAPAERVQLLGEGPDSRAHDFARLWALKEAYAKMLGLGHSLEFRSIDADLAQRRLHEAERDCKVAFETHMLWCPEDSYFLALAVGAERATEIDSHGHLLDLTGGSWFARSEISPQEAVWPKRWQWHWL
jgi:phosphopantetheinyl transferase